MQTTFVGAMLGDPLGPITRTILRALWDRLFRDEPGNPIYLPRVILDGYEPWGLPSYDPARPDGVSDRIPVDGVPQDVRDSACKGDFPVRPIATGNPTLQLLNVQFENLHVMRPVSLTFAESEPEFRAIVLVGEKTREKQFRLSQGDKDRPNFRFQIGCCEPRQSGSRDCGDQSWEADAEGGFVATAYDAQITLNVRVNAERGRPLTISVISLLVAADPATIRVPLDIPSLPLWAQQSAQIAINRGVASGSIVGALQTFLNQPDVKENIERLVNKALANL